MPPYFWFWLLVGLCVFAVVYGWLAARELARQKAGVTAKQRTVAQSLGPRILPFREKIESWVVGLAADAWPGDRIEPGIVLDEIRSSTGVYLRLRQVDGKQKERIGAAAAASLHDGFTSCFFIRKGEPDPRTGGPCQNLGDCRPGLLCNEWNICAPPPRPYNLRLAYRAMRVLSPEWVEQLREASSDLAVRVQERDLEGVTKNDVPVAIELLTRARYLTIVLDEDPEEGVPPPLGDAGAEPVAQRLQRVRHYARVGVWDLTTDRLLLRVRREASGEAVSVGRPRALNAESLAARQRQVNSCSLALAVRAAVAGSPPVSVPVPASGMPVTPAAVPPSAVSAGSGT